MRPFEQHKILSEQAARDSELESILHELSMKIEAQRNMIRALSYASIAATCLFFFLGTIAGALFS